MLKYYTITDEEQLLTAENEYALSRFYDNVQPLPEDYEVGKYIVENGELVRNPNYETEQEQKEYERIQALSMTRSDFFDGTIKAFGADSEDLLVAIQSVLAQSQMTDVEKKVAINNYKNALNFYRKHPLFTVLSGVPIPIGLDEEGLPITITITDIQWDKFFDETNKKNPDAWKELFAITVESEEVVNPDPSSDHILDN